MSLLYLQVIVGDFWQQNSGQRIISPSVGKVALAFVATIEVALAKAADAFLKSLALLVARQHHRPRRVPPFPTSGTAPRGLWEVLAKEK